MSSIALALAAAAAVSSAPFAVQPIAQGPTSITLTNPRSQLCGASFDPRFVRFVPPAPSAAGNPLLHWISGPGDQVAKVQSEPTLCLRALKRADFKP